MKKLSRLGDVQGTGNKILVLKEVAFSPEESFNKDTVLDRKAAT